VLFAFVTQLHSREHVEREPIPANSILGFCLISGWKFPGISFSLPKYSHGSRPELKIFLTLAPTSHYSCAPWKFKEIRNNDGTFITDLADTFANH
jgi:hypothetical protein